MRNAISNTDSFIYRAADMLPFIVAPIVAIMLAYGALYL